MLTRGIRNESASSSLHDGFSFRQLRNVSPAHPEPGSLPGGWRDLTGLAILCAAFATRQANTWPGVCFATFCAAGFGTLAAAATLGPVKDR